MHHEQLMMRHTEAAGLPPDAPKLFSHNADVDRINAAELAKLPGKGTKKVGTTDSEKALDETAADLTPTPTSAPDVAAVLAPTKVSEPELKSTPVAPAKHRVPMEFKETTVSQVPAFAADELVLDRSLLPVDGSHQDRFEHAVGGEARRQFAQASLIEVPPRVQLRGLDRGQRDGFHAFLRDGP